jgi:hypothetical protein
MLSLTWKMEVDRSKNAASQEFFLPKEDYDNVMFLLRLAEANACVALRPTITDPL